MSRIPLLTSLAALALLVPLGAIPGAAAAGDPGSEARRSAAAAEARESPAWSWPREAPAVVRAFERPPYPYGAGHRGIDVAGTGSTVRAPADGVVAFAGDVAGRPVLTLDHGDGWVSSFEPVTTGLRPGAAVRRGDEVGVIAAGGHGAEGVLHLGARHDGEYVNPLLLLGEVPRAILLPCCADGQRVVIVLRAPASETAPSDAAVTRLSLPDTVVAPAAPAAST